MPLGEFTPREGWVLQAYRYALDPTPRHARALSSHVGAARFAYNWAVSDRAQPGAGAPPAPGPG